MWPGKLVEPGDTVRCVVTAVDECNESAEKKSLPESITELASTDKVLVPPQVGSVVALTPPGGGGLSQYKCDLQENEVVFCNPEEEDDYFVRYTFTTEDSNEPPIVQNCERCSTSDEFVSGCCRTPTA